jgi:N4-gp56 family major capsid protein
MTSTTNSNVLRSEFFSKRFVEALRETLVAVPLGRREDAPRSSGKKIIWHIPSNPSAATTPLSEGADPTSPQDFTFTTAEATLAEHGDYFEPAKLFISTAASGTMAEIVDAAGYQAAITMDTLAYTQSLQDATSINDAGAAFTADDIRLAVSELVANNAKPHPATPGGRYYCAILRGDATWRPVDYLRGTEVVAGSCNVFWHTGLKRHSV